MDDYTPETLTSEEWRVIVGYEGLYEVSDWGRVKSLPGRTKPRERILRPASRSYGHPTVALSAGGVLTIKSVCELVSETFLGKRLQHQVLVHIDGDKLNERLSNLAREARKAFCAHCGDEFDRIQGDDQHCSEKCYKRTRRNKYWAEKQGKDPNIKAKAIIQQSAWRKANPDKARLKAELRRARKLSATIEEFTFDELLQFWAQNGVALECIYCGGVYEHIDHVIPLSKSGAHALRNLVPACKTCNSSKGPKSLSAWRDGRYVHILDQWGVDVTTAKQGQSIL